VIDRPLLTVDMVDVSYGVIRALHGISLSIEAGQIVTLIGANGAGKTTLLRTISGLLRPTGGTIRWTGKAKRDKKQPASGGSIALHNRPPHEIVRLGIAHVPEGRQIFSNMTVRENLILGAYTRKLQHKHPGHHPLEQVVPAADSQANPAIATGGGYELDDIYDTFPILGIRRHQKAGTLSGGEQQMLAIGRALMAHPKLLLLDEPSLGLAPLVVRQIFEIIRRINRAGTTIFLVEQNARMALSVAHHGYVLQSGSVIKNDQAARLLEDAEVRKAYLGG